MPANKKHLTQSGWIRFSKITAGFLGGFFVTISFHLVFTIWFDQASVLITSAYSGFILWAVLMILAFLIKKAWKVWGIYMGLILVFSVVIYFGKMNPIF
ncbi:hypothetical protein [Reichenbachiella sp. MALMAid0571]|uniref:hypothetical protein n=1 Tax=Reichenbachiella sp. MALMAid0571 TaxID=3143939 RepID=UPI0032DEF741